MSAGHVNAKRGDLVVVHTHHNDFIIGEGLRESDHFTVGVVTSITRNGHVKAYRQVGYSDSLKLELLGRSLVQVYVIPATQIDVVGAQKTASEHTWPASPTPRHYDSLAEVKAALRPHRIEPAVKP